MRSFGAPMIRQSHLCRLYVTLSLAVLVSCKPQAVETETKKKPETETATAIDEIAKLRGEVTFTLEDAEALNREYPDTFWIPPKERRENLVKDDLVKLVFNLSDGSNTQGERMWVIVKGGDRSGYSGVLDNDPYSTDQIKAGLELSFEPRHVIDIFEDEPTGADNAEPPAEANPAGRDR